MRVLFIASPDPRERYRFVMEPLMTTGMDVDCFRDRGNLLRSLLAGLAFLARSRRFDLVVLTGGDIRNLLWFCLVRLFTRAGIVMRFGGDPASVRRSAQSNLEGPGNRLGYLRGALGFRATRFMLKHADGVIAVSRLLAESIRPLAGAATRFCVSPPVVECDVVEIDDADDDEAWFRFCTVTNLNYREKAEGVMVIVEALAKCCAQIGENREIALDIVGGGVYLEFLKRELEKMSIPANLSVRLHGYQREVAGYFARADAFLYHSTLDSYPLVLVEATANALPIVVNDWGPFPELYGHEGPALIYETDNIDSLADALTRLTGEPDLQRALGERSLRQYRARDLRNSGVELERFLREIV